jgi:hypothetical protein
MADRVVETIESLDRQEHVIIVRRPDGPYSFRRQWRAVEPRKYPAPTIWPDGFAPEAGWDPPAGHSGLYDGPETAKWEALCKEALCKVDWMASVLLSN